MLSLQGKQIAVTGARKQDEVTKLVANFGGVAHIRPAQGTILTDEEEIGPAMRRVIAEGADWIMFTTGQGAQRLLDVARQSDMLWEWLRLLRTSKVAARGYKTRKFLKEWAISPDVSDDDGTTAGLMRAFGDEPLEGRKVVVQLHGERPERLLRWLADSGAVVETLMPYIHVPPPETEIRSFLEELKERKFDAVAFTSALQVRYLFEMAGRFGMKEMLRDRLSGEVLAAAVGKVTAEALEEEGVAPVLQPSDQRIGSLVVKLARYFQTGNFEEAQ
jgi:uroporphyrinogen-III synthase